MINFPQNLVKILVLLWLPVVTTAQVQDRVKEHTTYLASDELEGRGTGSKGIQKAAAYISQQFGQIGLQAPYEGRYLQKFPFPGLEEKESNVVGYIQAAKPSTKSIVFMAHYDALGIQKKEGQLDSICNGALDNAVGVAALIELANSFKKADPPTYNLVFVATAGEELGMHGSKYYVENPLFSKEDTIICLNIDGFNVSGPREDYYIFPRQGVNFVNQIETVLKHHGWYYNSPDWVDGMNTRFDTVSFLREGIPALTLWIGNQLKGGGQAKPIQFGGIHTPQDEITDQWNWDGVEDHLELYKILATYFLENLEGINVTDESLFQQ
ncbi:M20/M25/M40 family metallo-hydrolase [Flagellimonas sp.]|uniref:M20/M25/M40 family metallo-hydrolase n=1 Tax=Flagellimonas sp. TaxID=2058762 RepID=UPI003B523B63